MARAEHDILKCSSIHGQLQQLQCCVPLQCVLLLKLEAQCRCLQIISYAIGQLSQLVAAVFMSRACLLTQ